MAVRHPVGNPARGPVLSATQAVRGPSRIIPASFRVTKSLVDDFEDGSVDTATWSGNYGTVTEATGKTKVTFNASESALSSGFYSLQESELLVEVATVPAIGGSGTENYFSVGIFEDGSNLLDFLWFDGTLYTREKVVGVSDAISAGAYSVLTQRWLKISHTGSTVTWATSADGLAWTTVRTKTPTILNGYVSLVGGGAGSSFVEYASVNHGLILTPRLGIARLGGITLGAPLGVSAAAVTLSAAAAVSSATLAVTAQTQIPLGASAAVSTGTLAVTAQTTIPLNTSAVVSSATLAVTAKTQVVLNTAAAVSSATLALTAPAIVTCQSATAVSSATLSLTAQTQIPCQTSASVSSATLALTAATQIALQASNAVSSATLSVSIGATATDVPLDAASATATATLLLSAQTQVPLQTSSAVATGSLALTAQTQIVLQASSAVATASLAVSGPAITTTPRLGLLRLGLARIPGALPPGATPAMLTLSAATATSSATCLVRKTIHGTATGGINAALIAANSGDTVALATGSYALETITASKTIDTYLAPESGATVNIVGMIHTGSHHVYMRDMAFNSGSTSVAAIQVNALTQDLTLDNLTITGSNYSCRVGSGTLTPANWATRTMIKNCDFSGANTDLIQINGANDLTIQDNRLHDVDTSSGLHNDGIQSIASDGLIIRRNRIYFTVPQATGPNQGIILGRSTNLNGIQEVTNTTVENNVIYKWAGVGMTVSGVTNITIANNTIYDSGLLGTNSTFALSGVDSSGNYDNVNVTFANNITETMIVVNGAVRPDIETNNFVRTGGGGSNLNTTDPLFAATTGDSAYKLSSTSPAISAGSLTYAPTTDFDGVARDGTPDAGAREFVSGATFLDCQASINSSGTLFLTAKTAIPLQPADALSSAILTLVPFGGTTRTRTLLGAGI